MIQEELCSVVEESCEELDKGKHNHLLTALRALLKLKSWVSAGRTLVDNTPLIINHGLTIEPNFCILNIRLRCVIANNGYAVVTMQWALLQNLLSVILMQ